MSASPATRTGLRPTRSMRMPESGTVTQEPAKSAVNRAPASSRRTAQCWAIQGRAGPMVAPLSPRARNATTVSAVRTARPAGARRATAILPPTPSRRAGPLVRAAQRAPQALYPERRPPPKPPAGQGRKRRLVAGAGRRPGAVARRPPRRARLAVLSDYGAVRALDPRSASQAARQCPPLRRLGGPIIGARRRGHRRERIHGRPGRPLAPAATLGGLYPGGGGGVGAPCAVRLMSARARP